MDSRPNGKDGAKTPILSNRFGLRWKFVVAGERSRGQNRPRPKYHLTGTAGPGGTAGCDCAGGAGVSMMDRVVFALPARMASARLVAMKHVARTAVARVMLLAAPRADMRPPMVPPPIPSAPPSLRCSKTKPTSSTAIKIWNPKRIVLIRSSKSTSHALQGAYGQMGTGRRSFKP